MSFETIPGAPAESTDQSHREQRDKYIREAIQVVLDGKKTEVLKYHESPEVLVTMIQRELQAKSGLAEQLPQDPNRIQQVENEYPRSVIRGLLYEHFNVQEQESDALSEAIKQLY